MHKHNIDLLKRRAAQARALAEMVGEPGTASRLLGAAVGYEIEAGILEEVQATESEPSH
jgi:2-methylcitrate dehydratase PrpD